MDEAKANESIESKPTDATPATNPVTPPPVTDSSGRQLDFILDIPLRVSVELGRAKILVQDLLKLHKGSVMELNKLAGEPLEVLVNNRVVARGEVIVINEKFGIRLTDIVNHAERIRELGAAA